MHCPRACFSTPGHDSVYSRTWVGASGMDIRLPANDFGAPVYEVWVLGQEIDAGGMDFDTPGFEMGPFDTPRGLLECLLCFIGSPEVPRKYLGSSKIDLG